MPPATAADTSLHWVTFTAGDGDICDGTRSQPCTLEAVARARWDTGCSTTRASPATAQPTVTTCSTSPAAAISSATGAARPSTSAAWSQSGDRQGHDTSREGTRA